VCYRRTYERSNEVGAELSRLTELPRGRIGRDKGTCYSRRDQAGGINRRRRAMENYRGSRAQVESAEDSIAREAINIAMNEYLAELAEIAANPQGLDAQGQSQRPDCSLLAKEGIAPEDLRAMLEQDFERWKQLRLARFDLECSRRWALGVRRDLDVADCAEAAALSTSLPRAVGRRAVAGKSVATGSC
jgi:hypothetical protein